MTAIQFSTKVLRIYLFSFQTCSSRQILLAGICADSESGHVCAENSSTARPRKRNAQRGSNTCEYERRATLAWIAKSQNAQCDSCAISSADFKRNYVPARTFHEQNTSSMKDRIQCNPQNHFLRCQSLL